MNIKNKYEEIIKKHDEECKNKQAKLFNQAYKTLKKIELDFKKKGDLENILKLRSILENAEQDYLSLYKIQSKQPENVNRVILNLKNKYELQRKVYLNNISKVTAQYHLALSKKIKKFTQIDDIQTALIYKKELDRSRKFFELEPESVRD